MSIPSPHFLLLSESTEGSEPGEQGGRWRIVLEQLDGPKRVVVEESEDDIHGERLELLAVVRGLEALDQPSRVTLVTGSRYVTRGLRYGLREWRENGWRWEWYGRMVPVKNEDLWRRVDRALNFHELECRRWRLDESHGSAGSPAGRKAAESTERNDRRRRDSNLGKAAAMVRTGLRWCGRAVGGDRVDYPARRPARMAC